MLNLASSYHFGTNSDSSFSLDFRQNSMAVIQTLVYIYGFILLMSSVFTFFLYMAYKEKLLKSLLYFWLSGLFSFILQGVFNKDDVFGFLAFASHGVSIFFLLKIYFGLVEKKLPIKEYTTILIVGLIASILAFSFDVNFALSSSFFCMSVFLIFLRAIVLNTKKTSSHLYKGLSVLLFLNGLHFADYPIIRPIPELAILGFSIALAFYFIYSIYIPLFVIKKTSEKYSMSLEKQVLERTSELKNANVLLSKKNSELQELNGNLEQVTKENQMLLSVLVHDISNPVQVILSCVSNPDRPKSKERVKSAVNAILEILSTVKQFHAQRIGKITPNISQFDVLEVIESVVNQFEDKILEKGLKLETLVEGSSSLIVNSDKAWLRNQVFSNLISNAIKFSYPGEKILIEILKRGNQVSIKIRDFGPGIPEKLKLSIFSTLIAASTPGTLGEKGTGLGMPILKDYIDRLKGKIELLDLPIGEKGACFQVSIPVEYDEIEIQKAS